uniref:Uncharacterized protein n=1 Tax=Rhizophora mucronata TaxID=61149 RepID=A0A2P2QIZ5_RHIMU
MNWGNWKIGMEFSSITVSQIDLCV